MSEPFITRTKLHIELVRKNLVRFEGYLGLGLPELKLRGEIHDLSKFGPDEREGYAWLTSAYQGSRLTTEQRNKTQEALRIHAKYNAHHPEAHADLNQMSVLDLAEMIADWTAIAEEHGKRSCFEWTKENLERKWSFNDEKRNLIYELIHELDQRKLHEL